MNRILGFLLTGACLLWLVLPVLASDEESAVPSTGSGGFDYSTLSRQLTLDGLEGQTVFAGFILHKDKQEQPVVTWMAAVKQDKDWDQLWIDLNNDHFYDKDELFKGEVRPSKANENNRNTTIAIPEVEIGGVLHSQFRMLINTDPSTRGFYLSMYVGGNKQQYMRCGWQPGKSKRASLMQADPAKAPIFDFIVLGDVDIQCANARLPIEGKGMINIAVLTIGSEENAATLIGMRFFEKNDFELSIRYPTNRGQDDIFTSSINYRC